MKNSTLSALALAGFAAVSFADDPAAAAAAPEAPAPAAAAEEAVAVTIDGKPAITVAELDEMTGSVLRQYGSQIPPAMLDRAREDIRRRCTQQLIDQRLLVAEAAKLGVTVSPEEKLEALSDMTGGITNLETVALMSGTTVEQFDRMFSESVLAAKVVAMQTNGVAEPTEEDAKARFDQIVAEHPEAARMPEEVRAAHILVLVDKNAPAEEDAAALEKINGIRERALAGEDFGALAGEFSEDPGSKNNGGEYTFGRGRMVPEFENAAFTQEIGVVGEPVRTSYGYHILKVLDRREAKDVKFEDVSETIAAGMRQEAVAERVQTFLKGLRDAAKIEIVEKSVVSEPVAVPLKKIEIAPAPEEAPAAEEAAAE